MRAESFERVADSPLEMLVQRRLAALPVVVWNGLVQEACIAGLLEVRSGSEDEPKRVIVEAGPDRVVAAPGEGLILVIRPAIGKLGRSNVEDPLTRALGNHVHEAQQVLV